MRNILALFFLLSIFSINSFGQTPGVQWQIANLHEPLEYSSGCVTNDSGFILVANSIWKWDKSGVLQWKTSKTHPWSASYLRKGADGMYYAFGQTTSDSTADLAVIKFDSSGQILWEKSFGGSHSESLYCVTGTSDGGWVLGGITFSNDGDVTISSSHSYDSTREEAWLLKIDGAGNKVFQRTFGGGGDDYVGCMTDDGNGGIMLACYSNSTDGDFASNAAVGSSWLIRLDNAGNELLKRRLSFYQAADILKAADSSFVILGADYVYQDSAWQNQTLLSKVGLAGDSIWQKQYNLGKNVSPAYDSRLLQAENGSFVFLGDKYITILDSSSFFMKDVDDVVVGKTDAYGNLLWHHTYAGSEWELGNVTLKSNGHLLVSIQTRSSDGDFANGYNKQGNADKVDSWLAELDTNGNELWKKVFGGEGDDWAGVFVQNDQVFLGGSSSSFATNGSEEGFWLAKVGPDNIIKATVFIDNNSNGVKDTNEPFTTQANLVAFKGAVTHRAQLLSSGVFTASVDTGSYTVSITPKSAYYTAPQASQNSNFSTYFNTDSLSFALQPIPNKKDLSVSLFPLGVARPGFGVDYKLLYQNIGTTTIPSGQIVFKKDSRLNFVSASPAQANITGDSLTWNYTNLQPGDTVSILLNFTVAPPPTANINDTLSSIAFITPVAADETPANDTAVLKQVLRGSFDPNDKTENNGGVVQPSFITKGTPLQYVIRFQNTGSDTAFNIAVRDTLSSRVDPSSLEMVAASHPYKLSVSGRVLTWQFNNILLPDQTTNEPASHGYIVYTIKPKSDVIAGETIHNTASIYFDYNLPVLTNDAPTTVRASLAVLPQGLLQFYGNRHNATVSLYWKTAADAGVRRFEIERSTDGTNFNRIGSVSAQASLLNYAYADNAVSLSAPKLFYRLKMVLENGGGRYSNMVFFVEKDVTNASLQVYPNPFRQQGFVAFETRQPGRVELQVTNMAGKLLSREVLQVQPGKNIVPFTQTSSMPAGLYLVRLVADGETKSTVIAVY